MILLVHMIFGAAVGYGTHSLTGGIWISFIVALMSHYFLDFFPHVEYIASADSLGKRIKTDSFKSYFFDVVKVFLDFLFGLALILIFSNNQVIIYVFAFLAIIPDGITIINSLVESNILKKHQKLHGDIIQYLTKSKKFPMFWRIFTQVAALLVSIILLRI